jgi:transposase-like protein
MISIQDLISEEQCYTTIRELRWPEGVQCVSCRSKEVIQNGHKGDNNVCQKYVCKNCNKNFDDLTGTVFSGHHQPIKTWVLCLYFMGLNLSNCQIAQELDICESDAYQMTTKLREGIVEKTPEVILSGEVEMDEVYIVAGHKGQPDEVKKKDREGRRNRLKGARGRGTAENDKPPVFGMIQRGGEVVINMLSNVRQVTIRPIIEHFVEKGSIVYTDEYDIYNRLPRWDYQHKTVNHGNGEYARDEDGDGFHEVHVNTMEGFWSLLRSWLRPHRGISQKRLPCYLAFFQCVHNLRARGKKILSSLIGLLVSP